MKRCDTCDGAGWRIEVTRGPIYVYRHGVRCADCRGDGVIPETVEELEARRRRVYREDIAPNLGGPKEEADDGLA